MKPLLTNTDHKNVEKWAWEQVRHLPLSRKERLLWRTRLYLSWLDQAAKHPEALVQPKMPPPVDSSLPDSSEVK